MNGIGLHKKLPPNDSLRAEVLLDTALSSKEIYALWLQANATARQIAGPEKEPKKIKVVMVQPCRIGGDCSQFCYQSNVLRLSSALLADQAIGRIVYHLIRFCKEPKHLKLRLQVVLGKVTKDQFIHEKLSMQFEIVQAQKAVILLAIQEKGWTSALNIFQDTPSDFAQYCESQKEQPRQIDHSKAEWETLQLSLKKKLLERALACPRAGQLLEKALSCDAVRNLWIRALNSVRVLRGSSKIQVLFVPEIEGGNGSSFDLSQFQIKILEKFTEEESLSLLIFQIANAALASKHLSHYKKSTNVQELCFQLYNDAVRFGAHNNQLKLK